ncbi:MAG: type IV pilus secretin PilQ [Desulfotignum sp.]|nr:type IV pilus secretin PilQ [Desulfotignum sp.]
MAFFRRSTMFERILIMILTLGAGCTPLTSKAPVSSEILIQDETQDPTNHLHEVHMSTSGDLINIHIKTDQTPTYTSIKQDFPLGVAIYLPDTIFSPEFVPPDRVVDPVTTIQAQYADHAETTAKIDVLMNQDLPYEIDEEAHGLRVVLHPASSGKQAVCVSDPEIKVSQKEQIRPHIFVPSAGTAFARVTGIKFTVDESGFADIQVTTTDPVSYDTVWQADNQLDLILYKTRIPEQFQQPMPRRYAGIAVDGITPVPGAPDDVNAAIEIRIREKVPYRVVQDGNRIFIRFDPVNPVKPAEKQAVTPDLESADTAVPRYFGEKIKLDFFDTDIKNVFRILRSVSGLNFAVDKDVHGKVTMTLEKPVPWDQVLDLVLKMNGLGKKMEGDVVRIATIQTLRQEEKDAQDAVAARKKALEQKKSLEPLITEYIPISYSNAKADIEQQITKLLTPDRGSVSVDQRNNMIIVTDTRETVDRVQEMIYRLDTVTPQIMIEVKVVEVTKDFSRSIGVGWNLTNDPSVFSGFVNDMTVSVNTPVGAGGVSGDFSFFRLFGSSVTALNAKLMASETQGDARIVSSPRILTLNNKTARIKQGQEIAYLERDDAGGSAVNFKDVDLLLEVTPQVTPDKRISMRVFLTKNDVAGFTSDGVPFLTTNEAETELLVNDNETVVIGGIVKTTLNDDKAGLPFLTGIPILGNMLLGSSKKEDKRNELLIFLSPSIVQLEQKSHPNRPAN